MSKQTITAESLIKSVREGQDPDALIAAGDAQYNSTDDGEETTQEAIKDSRGTEIKSGDKVEHAGTVGTVVRLKKDGWIVVKWNGGMTSDLHPDDVTVVN